MPDQGPKPAPESQGQPKSPADPGSDSVAPWIPESKLPPLPQGSVNSSIRNILLTTPEFPRFYADLVLHYAPNSRDAKILRPHYQKICQKVNLMSNQNGTCTHIKVTGVRCGSPALKGEPFCYFHQNAIRSVRRPKYSRLHPIALIEDEESIQYALMEVINALMKNTIDLKRATLILRALHIAVKNASRVKFNLHTKDMVTQVPEYAPPPDNADFDETTEIDLPYNAWVPQKTERQIMEEKHRAQKLQDWQAQQARIRANLERARIPMHQETTHVATSAKPKASPSVGADAFVHPASEASVPDPINPPHAAPPTTVPPHNFKQTPPAIANPTGSRTQTRKPPQPTHPTPKERRNKTRGLP